MADILFEPRYALTMLRNPDLDWLREVILEPCRPGREFGEATLTFRESEQITRLIMIADRVLGYYLKYEARGDTWLSLGDAERLVEVVCPDDWEVSAGLFVPPERAWAAIQEFCLSGKRSTRIGWIRTDAIPEGGNW